MSITLVMIALSVLANIAGDMPGERLDVDAMIREAIEANPRVEVLRQRIAVAEAKIPQAGARPDPVVSFSAVNYPVALNPVDIDRVAMTQTQVSVAQTFLARGTLESSRKVAEHDLQSEKERLEDGRQTVASITRKAVLSLAYAQRLEELDRQYLSIFTQRLKAVESGYSVGRGTLQNVLQAKVALESVQAKLLSDQRSIDSARQRIALVLGRDKTDGIAAAPDLALSAEVPDRNLARTLALDNNTSLKIAENDIEKSDAEIALKTSRLNPDFTVKFAYGYRLDSVDLWTAGVSFNLPLWRDARQRPAVAEQVGRKRVAVAAKAALWNEIDNNLKDLLINIDGIRNEIAHYRNTVVPQVKLLLQASAASYEVDSQGFTDLVQAQMQLLDAEKTIAGLVFQHEMKVIDLRTTMGVVLDPASTEENQR